MKKQSVLAAAVAAAVFVVFGGQLDVSQFAKTLEIPPEGAVILSMRHTVQTIMHKKYSLPLDQVPVERVPFIVITGERLERNSFRRQLLIIDKLSESLAGP